MTLSADQTRASLNLRYYTRGVSVSFGARARVYPRAGKWLRKKPWFLGFLEKPKKGF